jgi:hypothetical protein
VLAQAPVGELDPRHVATLRAAAIRARVRRG